MRFAPDSATHRPMSSSTRIIVSCDSQIVPDDHACSFDLENGMVGSNQTGSSEPTRSTTACATSSAMIQSTDSGRCGPCCSIAPMGTITVASSLNAAPAVGPVSCSRRPPTPPTLLLRQEGRHPAKTTSAASLRGSGGADRTKSRTRPELTQQTPAHSPTCHATARQSTRGV